MYKVYHMIVGETKGAHIHQMHCTKLHLVRPREVCDYTDVKLLQKDEAHFDTFRNSLDHRVKELTHQRVGIYINMHVVAVTTHDKETAWKTNTFNIHSAQARVFFILLVSSAESVV